MNARFSGDPKPSTVNDARDNVLDRLAERYEHFAEREQFLRQMGEDIKAEGAHQYAGWILRAYVAEQDS